MIVNTEGQDVLTGTVVIVEDDDLMQSLMVEIFTDLGATCLAFITADDGLMYLMQSQVPCSLVVTDYTLPGQLDGRELAFMVRERWPNVPVIVTTGYGIEVGNDLPERVAFLQKPWSIQLMIETVRGILR